MASESPLPETEVLNLICTRRMTEMSMAQGYKAVKLSKRFTILKKKEMKKL